jgi:hypothetical protein
VKITEGNVFSFLAGIFVAAALLTGARWLDRNQKPYCEHRIDGPCNICRVPFTGPGRDPRGRIPVIPAPVREIRGFELPPPPPPRS